MTSFASEGVRRTILAVDDADDCLATLQLALETLPGVVIRPALSAEAALAQLEKSESGTVAAVITDVQLPEMTGLELVARIRQDPRFRLLPILVVSADADPSTPARALGLGANAYFAKPYSPSAMRKKLEELIHAS
ncbi:MAG: response regulator receiver protein [Bryobacterales bacterium]|jgi:two-component system chemotaxis response regulator CheY|nr:response regulator receiver protein [Bryobacterales bacterium]